MLKKTGENPFLAESAHVTAIFIVYVICAVIFGVAYRFAMNPDGIAQIRLAGYLAEGNFQQSVTFSWSPLFIWSMYPFLYAGFDGLSSARIAIGLSGAGLLAGSWLLSIRFGLFGKVRIAAGVIAALLISDWTIRNIAADLSFAAMIVFYLYLVMSPEILDSRKDAFYCGIAGGLSYLGHHYALPFFLAHFPLVLLLRGYLYKVNNGIPFKKILLSLAVGIAGFALIASIWIAIASVKYGQLKFSNKGNITYAVVGPKDEDRRHPFFIGGLFKPKDDYAIHVFEDPSDVKFKTWSPFESREYFMHQLALIKDNTGYTLNHFVNNSPFFTYAFIVSIMALVPISLILSPINREKKFNYIWLVMTFSIYCSGYLLVIARSPRRFYALMIVFLFMAVRFMDDLKERLRELVPEGRVKLLSFYLILVILGGFALKPGIHLLKSAKNIAFSEQVNPYKEIAGKISAVEFPAPYAIIRSAQKNHTDIYIAYYLKKQLLGRPASTDIDGITNELEALGGKSLLVFDNTEIVERLKNDGRYLHRASIRLENGERYKQAVNINIQEHEIITGWDEEVNIFSLK